MAADDKPGGQDGAGEGGRAAGSRRGELRELFLLFTKLGFVAFGGPAAHVAMMRQEVVGRRGWMGDQEFLDLNGATNLIPGPNSTELAIHIGRERAGGEASWWQAHASSSQRP